MAIAQDASLYDRLGGADAVTAATNVFYDKASAMGLREGKAGSCEGVRERG